MPARGTAIKPNVFNYIIEMTRIMKPYVTALVFTVLILGTFLFFRNQSIKKVKLTNYHNTEKKHKGIEIGDRLRLWGGYDYNPEWMAGRESHFGTVKSFIPGQNTQKAIVVALEDSIDFNGNHGKYIILETRYEGQTWYEYGPVHIELCDFIPDSLPYKDRRKGIWVEAAASYDFCNLNMNSK